MEHTFRSTTPICLIAVGMGLARYSILGSAAKNACVTAVKLLIQPAAVYVLCRLLGIPTLETEVTTLMAALPVGINVYMMAADFKAEEGATSSSILLSTMLSAVTVPLIGLRRARASPKKFSAAMLRSTMAGTASC